MAEPGHYQSSLRARKLLEYCDFGYVFADAEGKPTGLLANNVAVTRELWQRHGWDARVRRTGGCRLLYQALREEGRPMAFDLEQTSRTSRQEPAICCPSACATAMTR